MLNRWRIAIALSGEVEIIKHVFELNCACSAARREILLFGSNKALAARWRMLIASGISPAREIDTDGAAGVSMGRSAGDECESAVLPHVS